jgi:hypothetical protein
MHEKKLFIHKNIIKPASPSNKLIHIVFVSTFASAENIKEDLIKICNSCEQLSLVIKQEGNMENKTILALNSKIKIYAGQAWTLIHKRRLEEGWVKDSSNL